MSPDAAKLDPRSLLRRLGDGNTWLQLDGKMTEEMHYNWLWIMKTKPRVLLEASDKIGGRNRHDIRASTTPEDTPSGDSMNNEQKMPMLIIFYDEPYTLTRCSKKHIKLPSQTNQR